ncbi:MAG: site-specific integrase [Cyclobacteriaceae bacterium]
MQNQNTYTIIARLKKEKRLKTKRALIMIRLTVNGQRSEISIKRRIDPERWDSHANRVKGNKEDAKEINSLIDTLILKLNKIYNKLVENDEIVTATRIKDIYLGKDVRNRTLLEVFKLHNEMVKSRVGVDFSTSTYTRYQTTFDHVSNFLLHQYKLNDILLKQIQYPFITDLEHYLKTNRKCNHNSTQKYIRNFRKIINNAIKNDWLDKDPFKAYRVKLKDTKRVFLTKEELTALEEKQFAINRLDQVRDVFVFCCYTGLSYVDVEKLTPKGIVKGHDGEYWISVDRTKTGSPSSVPILPKALRIIEKYKDDPRMINTGRLLPVISNQRINAYLKELASLTGIEKKLTFHAARHTFATTVTLSNGIPIETVSAMLGHKNFRTTQIYAKVVQEKISRDMQALKEKLS